MIRQELLDCLRFVRRPIVAYDVNFARPFCFSDQLLQKPYELGAGVSPRRFPLHPAGLYVQRRIQRQCAVPVILKAVPFGATRRSGQHRVQPIQGLNRSLLIDAEHRGVLRPI